MIKTLEERIQDQEAVRQMCAAFVLRALRDWAEGSDEAQHWLFSLPDSFDSDSFDEEFSLEYGLTFPRACAILELDPKKLLRKIEEMDEEGFELMRSKLRRSKSPRNNEDADEQEPDQGNGSEDYDLLNDGEA